MADISFHAHLANWQKFLIALVLVVIAVIAVMISISPYFGSTGIGLGVLGLFVQISGVLLLSLGLVRTNDDLVTIAQHPKQKDEQKIVTHLATERFQIMLALFLLVLGMLLQLVGMVS